MKTLTTTFSHSIERARNYRYLIIFVVALVAILWLIVNYAITYHGIQYLAGDKQPSSSEPGGVAPIVCGISLPQASNTGDASDRTRILNELDNYIKWLETNQASGFIGEVGWPRETTIDDKWNTVADAWYAKASNASLWTSAWATGSWWGEYRMNVYGRTGESTFINQPSSQAAILEKYATVKSPCDIRHGINVAGMEFGTDNQTFNNASRGEIGTDYFYEPSESFDYLATRGVSTIRLPFRWERIQPTLGGELNQTEVAQIIRMLDAAQQNEQKVILDLHNYGEYRTPDKVLKIGDGQLTDDALADVWLKLSNEFKSHPALLAYDIMNEPTGLQGRSNTSPAQVWEQTSQHVLTSLRNADDETLIMIPGYDWSSLVRWSDNHPDSWISDPIDNFRYEAHHYWDKGGEGHYVD